MKKKFNYFRANPAGNITGFVLSPIYPGYRKVYTKAIIEQIDNTVEQVGFISPAYEGAPLRMDMMGGEFCGNATRAYGLYSATFYDVKGDVDIEVYVSGVEGVVDVVANVENSTAYVLMPNAKNISTIEVEGKTYKVVDFGGIVHTIIDDREEDKDFVKKVLEEVKKHYKSEAYGVLFFNKEELKLVPYVEVVSTETLIREGSCGSGTLAVGYYLNENLEEDFKAIIKQPAGELEIIYEEINGKKGFLMGGKVELEEERVVEIEISPEEVKSIKAEYVKEKEAEKEKED